MAGFGTLFFGKRGRRGFLPAVAVLCLILVAILAVAQIAHEHANPSDADHCPLCVTMHTVAPVAIAAAAIVLVRLDVPAIELQPIVVSRQPQFRLFIRPPPVSL